MRHALVRDVQVAFIWCLDVQFVVKRAVVPTHATAYARASGRAAGALMVMRLKHTTGTALRTRGIRLFSDFIAPVACGRAIHIA